MTELPIQIIKHDWSDNTIPMVSVVCITFNHKQYIREAIESFLMQMTNFKIEILIGEDCSTDGTREIAFGYKKKYPDLIRVITSDSNVGMNTNGIRTLNAARGKYIALCEGDDYWTDPYKLQKQVDFLDGHPDFTICSHNVYTKYEDQSRPMVEWLGSDHKEVMTIEDLFGDGTGGATCSLVYRNKVFGELPDWFSQIAGGDTTLQILCASRGKMRYFKDVMSVYRIHSGGVCSGVKQDSQAEIDRFESGGVMKREIINRHFNYRYDKLIRRSLIRYYYPNLVRAYVSNWRRTIGGANKYARKLLSEAPGLYPLPMRKRIKLIILIIISDILIRLHKIIACLVS